MPAHVHYDLASYEKQLRAQVEIDRAKPVDEFHRLELMGGDVMVQFAVFAARLDNEGVDEERAWEASAAVVASLVENFAGAYSDRDATIIEFLQSVANYALQGGEVIATTKAPIVDGGHA